MAESPHPLRREDLAARVGPFVGAALAGLLLSALPDGGTDLRLVAVAGVLTAAIVAAGLCVPWERLPRPLEALLPFAYVFVVAILREAGGGRTSGVTPLLLLPVFWLALYGRRRQLVAVIGCGGATLVLPAFVDGGGLELADLRRGVLWLVVAAIVGLTVQRLVQAKAEEAAESQRRANALSAVARMVREISTSSDARRSICQAARHAADADMAMLLEHDGDRNLVMSACSDPEIPRVTIRMGLEASGAALVFASRERLFLSDGTTNPLLAQRLQRPLGLTSVLFEPIVREDHSIGVLVVGWRRHLQALDIRAGTAIELLAAESSAAIEREDLLHRLERLARTDSLTGLANRRTWQEELPRRLDEAARSARPVCVALLDIDRFKALNDSEGHQAGDRILKACAAAWQAQLRSVDVLARLGGDEFAVLLPDCDQADAVEALDRLRATTPRPITCSIGVVVWDGDETPEAVVGRADAALYAAKLDGRDRVASA